MCLAGCTPRTAAAAPRRGALPRTRLPLSALAPATMFQPTAKRGFTIESLVAKDGGSSGGTGGGGAGSHPLAAAASEEPLRPTALNYPHPGAAEAAFVSGFPAAAAGAGRSLYGGPELVFPEAMNHPALTVHPAHQLGASPLQPPHSFFGAQHRDPLHFYPWVLRNRFFGHRFQELCKPPGSSMDSVSGLSLETQCPRTDVGVAAVCEPPHQAGGRTCGGTRRGQEGSGSPRPRGLR
ncbi:homeobox protein EMX1 isoform X2 [Phyllostomus hastatus]|uniref:homeobox protein EMX1 isoform X2 n=1 Tax=Phyllostomus hastatus TaxID=9423 RepID=UPI001E68056C|nr:homeobox protein EMX1 isoform X2 [Phyllostomus hastatus]